MQLTYINYIRYYQNKLIMKRRDYIKPSMVTIEVQHTQMLLTSDPEGVTSERRGYGRAVEEDWE